MDARVRQIKRAGDSAIASRAGASETCDSGVRPADGNATASTLPSVARFGAPVPRCRKVSDPQGQLREVLRPRASCRPDDPFCSLPQPPGDLDRVAAKHKPRDLEEQLVLDRPDLRLDDLDGQIRLLAAYQPRGWYQQRRSKRL